MPILTVRVSEPEQEALQCVARRLRYPSLSHLVREILAPVIMNESLPKALREKLDKRKPLPPRSAPRPRRRSRKAS